MIVNINTNVFTVIAGKGKNALDLTIEFNELSDVLRAVLNKWNEVQCRHEALLAAEPFEAKKLRAMAETLITVCDKAVEHSDKCYREVLKHA